MNTDKLINILKTEIENPEGILEDISCDYLPLIKALEKITNYPFPLCLTLLKYDGNEKDENCNSACICGKERLKYLNFFSTENETLILGSSCVENLNTVVSNKQYELNILNHFKEVYDKYRDGLKKFTYKKCLSCKDLKIRIGYDYKNELNKFFCKDCCTGEKVKCIDCRTFFKSGLDYKGNHKTQCLTCWKKTKGYIK